MKKVPYPYFGESLFVEKCCTTLYKVVGPKMPYSRYLGIYEPVLYIYENMCIILGIRESGTVLEGKSHVEKNSLLLPHRYRYIARKMGANCELSQRDGNKK